MQTKISVSQGEIRIRQNKTILCKKNNDIHEGPFETGAAMYLFSGMW